MSFPCNPMDNKGCSWHFAVSTTGNGTYCRRRQWFQTQLQNFYCGEFVPKRYCSPYANFGCSNNGRPPPADLGAGVVYNVIRPTIKKREPDFFDWIPWPKTTTTKATTSTKKTTTTTRKATTTTSSAPTTIWYSYQPTVTGERNLPPTPWPSPSLPPVADKDQFVAPPGPSCYIYA
jgi:hypothetical protein